MFIKTPKIKVGTFVVVPDPKGDDIWNHSFQARVIDIVEVIINKNIYRHAIVEDGDSDCFEVELGRLIVKE